LARRLVYVCFEPDLSLPRFLMLGAAYFLLGDSAPRDAFIADALKSRLGRYFSCWVDQQDILPAEERSFRRVRRRARAFQAFMAQQPFQHPPILMGRSSGARVASICASACSAAAVVCFGYPFRHPGKDVEPDRYQHLATTQIPTLILQGRSDPYGGADDLAAYALSESVSVRFIETDHNMKMRPRDWDDVASTVLVFCRDALAISHPSELRADENSRSEL
jgi:pimeloyl-ACP methyl ester carboxylesterase